MAMEMISKGATKVIYDGECPLCSHFAKSLSDSGETIELINARTCDPIVEDVRKRGFNLDSGMVVIADDTISHGSEAMRILSHRTAPRHVAARIAYVLFRRAWTSRLFYPPLKFIRRLLLWSKGVPLIKDDLSLLNGCKKVAPK